MISLKLRRLVTLLSLAFLAALAKGQEDPGRVPIGQLDAQLIFATNEEAERAGEAAKVLPEATIAVLKKRPHLSFSAYRLVGRDRQEILRGYENWATLVKPSKEILLRFQPRARPGKDKIQLDLEYWQAHRKIMATDPVLSVNKPMYILGPKWRGGRLILQVTVTELR